MKRLIVVILMLNGTIAFTQSFEFNGFKLGMSKKELNGLSIAMRPWIAPNIMDMQKDEWDMRPKNWRTLPTFPKTETCSLINPKIFAIKLYFTNEVLCKIEIEGETTRSPTTAFTWAKAAQEIISKQIGKPISDSKKLEDKTSYPVDSQNGNIRVLWSTAAIFIFRLDNPKDGAINMFFEVSSYKTHDINNKDEDK